MKISKGIIQFLPLIVVAGLLLGLLIATRSVGKITNFFNKAADSWTECINTPKSIIQETYPAICVFPDGRRVTQAPGDTFPTALPTSPSNLRIKDNPSSTSNAFLIGMINDLETTIPLSSESPEATVIPSPFPRPLPTQQGCTQEAKICPDGSFVGRTGPNCEFAACSTIQPNLTFTPTAKPLRSIPAPTSNTAIGNDGKIIPLGTGGPVPGTEPISTSREPSVVDSIVSVFYKIIAIPVEFFQSFFAK